MSTGLPPSAWSGSVLSDKSSTMRVSVLSQHEGYSNEKQTHFTKADTLRSLRWRLSYSVRPRACCGPPRDASGDNSELRLPLPTCGSEPCNFVLSFFRSGVGKLFVLAKVFVFTGPTHRSGHSLVSLVSQSGRSHRLKTWRYTCSHWSNTKMLPASSSWKMSWFDKEVQKRLLLQIFN